MKSAVIYYSRTGKTSEAAIALANKVSGDLVEIKDLKNRAGIIGWIKSALDARGSKITQIEPENLDLSEYDTLYIGTPVWAGKPAPAINTIINNWNISGKDIVPFVTLGGSNYHGALSIMSDSIKAKGGKIIKTIGIGNSGKKSSSEIENEINSISL